MPKRCPCRPDCPDRSSRCHSSCRAYLEYYAEKKQYYADKLDKKAAGRLLAEGAARTLRSIKFHTHR